jgi:hypothetical protein
VERLGSLHSIPDLVATRDVDGVERCIRGFKFPCDVTEEEWLAGTKIVGDATAELGLYPAGVWFIRDAITKSWPSRYIEEAKLEGSLRSFVSWLDTQKDATVLDFCWDLLAVPKGGARGHRFPVLWMKSSGRLRGEISFDNLQLAVALAEEGEIMRSWPEERWRVVRWTRDSAPYLQFMDHSSYLVRAAAADCLGHLFRGCAQKPSVEAAPPTAEMMEFLRQSERRNAGVAGPFLFRAQWGSPGWPGDRNYDYRSWFMDVLRTSERGRYVPHELDLEFFAHEYFSSDADAIEEFLLMGRRNLAVMAATECPEAMDDLLPLLQKMAASDDPQVARAITEYLADGAASRGFEVD